MRQNGKTLLVHWGHDTPCIGDDARAQLRSRFIADGPILTGYAHWAQVQKIRVTIVLPESVENEFESVVGASTHLRAVFYDASGRCDLTDTLGRAGAWLVNGKHLPMIDWSRSSSAARRRGCDVTLFGEPECGVENRYEESVAVSDTGEVLDFVRHYSDAPGSPNASASDASYLIVGGDCADDVVHHIVTNGWDLASIGGLTRRFSVASSDDVCVRSYFATPKRRSPLHTSSAPSGGHVATRKNRKGIFGGRRPMLKRTADIVVSGLGLLVLAPLMLFIALLVKATSRGPTLFAHTRQGRGGKEFGCLKFRTMCDGADALQTALRGQNEVDGPQFKITSDPRLTKIGTFLRQHNLDELPQLINVLRGEMSLVGPRPSPEAENQLCPAWRRARLSVTPGITGLWQVLRMRDDDQSDFQEWIYYDIEYSIHGSIWLDAMLLIYTPVSMFAPKLLTGLSRRLHRRGICSHSARRLRRSA